MDWARELDIAKAAARTAGEAALRHQCRGVSPQTKPDLTPVTEADKDSERIICERLLAAFPDDGLLGEEGARVEARSGRRWIIDPIDGTRDFIRGLPLWAILIGLEVEGEIVAGVAHSPARNELYWAAKGTGAWCNDERLRASAIAGISDAIVCVNGLKFASRYQWAPHLIERLAQVWAVRSLGGCMDALMVAAGKADIWLETESQPWDLAPLDIILHEAGAVLVDFEGRRSIYGGNALAFTPALRDAAFSLVADG